MTEQEWLECADPKPMLKFLTSKASERKLQLFAVLVCGRLLRLLQDPRSRRAVDVAERNADSQAGEAEQAAAADAAWTANNTLEEEVADRNIRLPTESDSLAKQYAAGAAVLALDGNLGTGRT